MRPDSADAIYNTPVLSWRTALRTFVVLVGLLVGAIVGFIVAIFTGLIPFTC